METKKVSTQDIEKALAQYYRDWKYFFMTGVKNWKSYGTEVVFP